MKLIGLTGGMGSGKSTVAEMLRKRGWEVVASDDTAKEVMAEDAEVRREIAAAFGEDILTPDGVDRKRLAEIVFASPDAPSKLNDLNRIVHPRVLGRHSALIEQRIESGADLLAIESALIFEVGLEEGFDWIIVVDADTEIRVTRAMTRLGITREQALARIQEQTTSEEKRGLADFVIENNQTLTELTQAVETIASIVELLPES